MAKTKKYGPKDKVQILSCPQCKSKLHKKGAGTRYKCEDCDGLFVIFETE